MSRQDKGPQLRAVGTDHSAQSAVHIGMVFKRHRQLAGMTQEQAASKSGLTRNTIIALERARFPDPHLSTMLALVEAYGLGSLEQLLGDLPSPLRLRRVWLQDLYDSMQAPTLVRQK